MRAKRYGTGTGKTVRDGDGQNGAGPVRAKRYGTGRGKTLRGPYGQNGTGPVGAKRYGTGTGKTVRGPYGLRCGLCTGHGVGAVRGPRLSPCAARTGNMQGPFGCPYHGCPYHRDWPYHARKGMFTGTHPINCFFRCSVHHMNGQPDN